MDWTKYGKPHTLLHIVSGVGLGFLLAGLVLTLANPILGIILVVVGVGGHYFVGAKPAATPKS